MQLSGVGHKIKESLSSAMPELREIALHGGRISPADIAKYRKRANAAVISVLRFNDFEFQGGALQATAAVAIFISARSTKDDDGVKYTAVQTGVNLVSAAVQRLQEDFEVKGLSAQDFSDEDEERQTNSVWIVSAMIKVSTLPALSEAGVLPRELYVGIAPEVGPDHLEAYIQIGGADNE